MEVPIIMEESSWRNSFLSVVSYYGAVTINKKEYSIVNKEGITLLELCDPTSPHFANDLIAISPGEPADLIQNDWIPVYKALGRKKTFEIVKSGKTLGQALKIVKEMKKLKKDGNAK